MASVSKHEYLLGRNSEICRASVVAMLAVVLFSVMKTAWVICRAGTGYCALSHCMADTGVSVLLCF